MTIPGGHRDGWLSLAQAALEWADNPSSANARILTRAVKPAWKYMIPADQRSIDSPFYALCREGQSVAPDRDAIGNAAEAVIAALGEPGPATPAPEPRKPYYLEDG